MLPRSKRPPPGLPTTRFIPSSASSDALYKDKRPPSLRIRLQSLCSRPLVLVAVFLAVFVGAGWALGLFAGGERPRLGGGTRVVARDWEAQIGVTKPGTGGALVLGNGTVLPAQQYNETVLILCPMRNSLEHIWHFFHLVDQLTYPRHLLQLAILVSDSQDRTYARALELADERQYGRKYRGKRYGRMSVFRRDFAEREREGGAGAYEGENVGAERHKYDAQVGRRKLLAKSRTWLLQSAMSAEVDWALWLDVDVVDYEPQLVERLVGFAKGELPAGEGAEADVVVPNCVWKTYNEMGAYDRNNWVETPESLAHQATLSPSDVLIEGYPSHPTYRFNLASLSPSSPSSLSPSSPYLLSPSFILSTLPSFPPAGLTLPSSLISRPTLPQTLDLDGVGGCAALVRAEVHREGAVFPAWPPVENQIETEGFAQLVKALRRRGGKDGEVGKGGRGRLVGLPGYFVYHGLYG
ncbi:hypothetical protein JCM10207_008334 [Rhodosporidiobolus poonsookiae]